MNATQCMVDGCENDLQRFVRGMCLSHYNRRLKHGEIRPRSVAERFSQKLVSRDSGCIEWTGYVNGQGYGQTWFYGDSTGAHRVAWILANGPIPDGLCVLHHCDNPRCCNVEHLFLGTRTDNNADMLAKRRGRNGRETRTHCPQGHLYDEGNTYVNANGWRSCRTCAAAYDARRRPRKAS